MFTEAILQMIFEELSAELDLDYTFDEWAEANPSWTSWTDQQIYAALPTEFLPYLGEFGLNASWMHGGM